MYPVILKKPYNVTTNTLKDTYLSAQLSSLSAFIITKTDLVSSNFAEDS